MSDTRVRSNSLGRPAHGISFLVLVWLMAYLVGGGCPVARAQQYGVPQSGNYPTQVDPWEVILYEHPQFAGTWIRYRIEPGMRQKVVAFIDPALEDRVSSIQVGEKVNVIIFADREFHAGDFSWAEAGGFGGYEDLGWSVAKLGENTAPLNDKISSLIIYPKAAKLPLGVWLWDERTALNTLQGNIREMTFFPLPESEERLEQGYPFLGYVNLDKNINAVGNPGRSRKGGLVTTAAWANNIQVTLYEQRNYQGASLTLPGAAGWGTADNYNLGQFGWSDRAASLVVRWIGPPLKLGPPVVVAGPKVNAPAAITEQGVDYPGNDYKSFATDGGWQACEQACLNDPTHCKAYTWVKPGVQGPKAVCWLKSSAPFSVVNPNCVSGTWGTKPQPSGPKVNAPAAITEQGVDYPGNNYKSFATDGGWQACEQACLNDPTHCKAYTWVKPGVQGPKAVCWLKSSAAGSVANPNCVSGTWGTKPQPLASTLAQAQPALPAAKAQGTVKLAAPDLSGQWNSNIGLIYDMVQKGNQFEWTVSQTKEVGLVTVSGTRLSASWKGPQGSGSSTGQITATDATGKPSQIDWENGVRFYRPATIPKPATPPPPAHSGAKVPGR